MTKRQVAELLAFINEIYPRFEVTQGKIDTWHMLMKNQNPEKVMKKMRVYATKNKFPPTVADLYEEKRREHSDEILKKIEMWEKNAKPRS